VVTRVPVVELRGAEVVMAAKGVVGGGDQEWRQIG
jgi:hypothetical protein